MKRGKLPIIITVCVLVIAAIIISCIEFPSSIKADTDVTELSVTRGKDGKKQEIADSSRIISLLDGMKVKKYSLVSKIKGDTLKSGWEYRLSYKAADGSSNSITISHGEVEYKGKKYKTTWSKCPHPRNDDGILVLETGRKWAEKNYLFPLPKDQLQLNPNLKQNPGWE